MQKLFLKEALLLLSAAAILNSCALLGLNMNAETPKHEKPYPVFTERDSLRGALNPYRSCYDVYYYDLAIDLDLEKHYLKGNCKIYFKAVEETDTIQLDLFANLKINGITQNESALSFWRKYDAVFIVLNTVSAGNSSMIAVDYEGEPIAAKKPPWDGGFVWKKDKNKNPWVGVACEQKGASLWWPVKDHLSDEPDSMKFSMTIPEGLMGVSNGVLVQREKGNGRESFTWKTHYPINNYNLTFYIGDFRKFSLPYKNDSLQFYVLPENLAIAKTHFQQCTNILKTFEELYGEYPYPIDGYKLVESPYEGMEHQTAIAYGNGYKESFLGYGFDYIILHESAHEWWGNSVSVGDVADIWIHEGMATYSEALYVEKDFSHEDYLRYLRVYSMFIKNKKPVVGPYDVNYWSYKDSDPYMKGALMLHTFRNLIKNDSVFFDLIKSFYANHQYGIATTQNFLDLVKEKTVQDYSWFFNQYLFSRVCPQLEYRVEYNNDSDKFELIYRWNNVEEDFRMPVSIKNGTKTITLLPSPVAQRTTLAGPSILFNPDGSYLSFKENKKLMD